MTSIFTVRERILLYLLDQGKDKWVLRTEICKTIHSKSGNACGTFKELVADGVLICRRAKGIKGGGTTEFCITEKGLAIACTQVWRMRNAGIKAVPLLPSSDLGRPRTASA